MPFGPLRPLRRLGLRARTTFAFALLALVLSATLALFSYEVTRRYLMDQRVTAAQRQAFGNARALRDVVHADPSDTVGALAVLQTSQAGGAVVRVGGVWLGTSVLLGQSDVPVGLLRRVADGGAGYQRVVAAETPYAVVGVPVNGGGAAYFEFVPLAELARTLDTLARVLLAAAAATTVAAAAVGAYASRRVLRPVEEMAEAAGLIGEGSLEQLDVAPDPDLDPLVASFNAMVAALQERIERERRFASDVSHELRGPLAAMAASLSVARRQTPAGPAVAALDQLQAQVEGFTGLVLDLLEISRAEAGVAELRLEPTDLGVLADVVVRDRPEPHPEVVADGPCVAVVDRRRVGQVLANLLDNADRYGGGARVVTVGRDAGVVRLAVDDAGPGVPEHERAYVFERFARGEGSSGPDAPSGTGLGLALVAEHVRLHDGRAWVEASPLGGARFVIELPAAER